jgi:arsenate reductase
VDSLDLVTDEHVTIFHNPQCSTSTKVVGMADELGADVDLVLYLKEPPTREKLTWLVKHLLGSKPADLVRKDPFFESLGLDPDDYTTQKAVVDLLLEHPRLMQRPVLVKGDRVVIGRPVDRARELLES